MHDCMIRGLLRHFVYTCSSYETPSVCLDLECKIVSTSRRRGEFRPFGRVGSASLACAEAGVEGKELPILRMSYEQGAVIVLHVAIG